MLNAITGKSSYDDKYETIINQLSNLSILSNGKKSKIRLGINIDHIATIKTNRRTPYPSLTDAVKIAEESGADLITIHLREDRRHIQDQDLRDIKAVAKS